MLDLQKLGAGISPKQIIVELWSEREPVRTPVTLVIE
jgi:hypothetical protein